MLYGGESCYCAPEVVPDLPKAGDGLGKTSVTEKVDIWSLGATIWRLLCGTPPVPIVRRHEQNEAQPCPLDLLPLHLQHVSAAGIDFLRLLLLEGPADRPDATHALAHSWFLSAGKEADNAHDLKRSVDHVSGMRGSHIFYEQANTPLSFRSFAQTTQTR